MPTSRTAYFREYQKRRYAAQRAKAVAYLGGKCVDCGSSEQLQIDHIDRKQKKHGFGGEFNLSWGRLLKEVQKCQLLCKPCHEFKTIHDLGFQHADHGTYARYNKHGCRCADCRAANTAYTRKYRALYGRR